MPLYHHILMTEQEGCEKLRSMFPEKHPEVDDILLQSNLHFTFYEVDDEGCFKVRWVFRIPSISIILCILTGPITVRTMTLQSWAGLRATIQSAKWTDGVASKCQSLFECILEWDTTQECTTSAAEGVTPSASQRLTTHMRNEFPIGSRSGAAYRCSGPLIHLSAKGHTRVNSVRVARRVTARLMTLICFGIFDGKMISLHYKLV